MSGESHLSPDQPTAEQAPPAARLIAEAVHRHGGQRKSAAAITEASYDISRNRQSVSPSSVGDWMTGTIPGPTMRRWIARGLKIPLADLEAAIKEQQRPQREARRAAFLQRKAVREAKTLDLASLIAGPLVESDDVKRRAFFVEMRTLLLAIAGTGAATGIDFDRYAAVLTGTRADERALDDFERITLGLVRQEATVSAQSLMPAVRGHLTSLRDLLVWTPPGLAQRAYSLAGQTALLAGYLKYQQDSYTEADDYWSLAERFGDMAGDGRLRAALLELQASRWSSAGEVDNLPLALDLLDRAVALLGRNPEPASGAYILSFSARRHAEASRAQPDHAAQAMRDLEAVQTHLSRLPSGDASVYVVGSVAGEAIQGHARALIHLNHPAEAAAHLERLLASIEDRAHSWRAGIMVDLAAAHAATGEAEYAVGLLSHALSLARQAAAGRNLRRVHHARKRWLAGHDGPALRDLDDQLRALPPAISA